MCRLRTDLMTADHSSECPDLEIFPHPATCQARQRQYLYSCTSQASKANLGFTRSATTIASFSVNSLGGGGEARAAEMLAKVRLAAVRSCGRSASGGLVAWVVSVWVVSDCRCCTRVASPKVAPVCVV